MQEAFARAFVIKDFTAFGFDLKPYTLAHSFALALLGCAVAEDVDGEPTIDDCGLAAWVCGLSPDDVRRKLTPPDSAAFAERLCGLDPQAEALKLSEYFQHYRACPPRWQSEATSPRAPWQWIAVARLCRMGDSVASAWATPLHECIALCAADDAYNGDKSLMSDAERKIVGVE